MKFKYKFYILLSLALSFSLVACNKNKDEIKSEVTTDDISNSANIEDRLVKKDKKNIEDRLIVKNNDKDTDKKDDSINNGTTDNKDSANNDTVENEENKKSVEGYTETLFLLNNEEFNSTTGPSTAHSKIYFSENGYFEGKSVTNSQMDGKIYGDGGQDNPYYREHPEYYGEDHEGHFKGKFSISKRIDDYSYVLNLDQFDITSTLGAPITGDGRKYVYGIDYALDIDKGDQFIFFTKDTPRERLLQESESLADIFDNQSKNGYASYVGNGDFSLGYIIYNKTQDKVFHQWMY